MYRISIFLLLLLTLGKPVLGQDSYHVGEVADGVYAAIAQPGGAASSNAMIVDLGSQLVLCGAHFSRKAINDLIAAASEVSPNPIRAFVLAHHHQGYSFIDFDFPAEKDLAMSIDTRLIMRGEARELSNPLIIFKEGLTFEGTERTLVLSNIGPAHSNGDLVVYVPQSKVLFTSDLLYFDSVGYLGAGSLRDWAHVIGEFEVLQPKRIIPGFGPVGTVQDLRRFNTYLKDFLTEVLSLIESGKSLEESVQTFNLPQYEDLPGYHEFTPGNVERAYLQLKVDASGQ